MPSRSRYGLIRPQIPPHEDATRVQLCSVMTPALPDPPTFWPVPGRDEVEWGWMCNDRLRCCVVSGEGHFIQATTHAALGTATTVSDELIEATYRRLSPDDRGLLISQFLDDMSINGMGEYTIFGSVAVDPWAWCMLKLAICQFGGIKAGCMWPRSAIRQMEVGEPLRVTQTYWDPVVSLHDVEIFGYDPRYLYGVTSGRVVSISYGWWSKWAEEAWARVSETYLGLHGLTPLGLNVDALLSALPELRSGRFVTGGVVPPWDVRPRTDVAERV